MTDKKSSESMIDLEKELGFEEVAEKKGDLLAKLSQQVIPEDSNLKRKLPVLIDEIVQKGIKLYLTGSGYEIDGFYRLGSISLIPDYAENVLLAVDKKEEVTKINHFDDLVRLNYNWWKKSKNRQAYASPEKPWEDEFLRLNLIKRQYIYTPND